MLTIDVRHDIERVTRGFTDLELRQLPFALSLAVNKTAERAHLGIQAEMRRVFDRPTPFTLRSLRVVRGNKAKPEATIGYKDKFFAGADAEKYIGPQVYGGTRSTKRFEVLLAARGLMPSGWVAVPASGARLDAYGNVSRGQIQQILSALRAQFDPLANRSLSKRSQRKARQAQYFVARIGGTLGVWQRFAFAFGSAVKPVFIFAPSAHYTPRLDFYGVGERVVAREFEGELDRALRRALATAITV